MAIADLLMSQRRWGRTRCRKLLAMPITETKTIGSLTERQRTPSRDLDAQAQHPEDPLRLDGGGAPEPVTA